MYHFSAVVLGYNLPGVVQLNLTRDHVVGIYNGTYTRWNDPELQVRTGGLLRPERCIAVTSHDLHGHGALNYQQNSTVRSTTVQANSKVNNEAPRYPVDSPHEGR